MKEQWIETLNIMGKGDIYQENFANIIDLYIRNSRGSTRLKPTEHDRFTRDNKIFAEGVTHAEIGNLLENFISDILGTLTTQLDIMQAKQKQAETEQNLAIFYPRCKKKHSPKECPLDAVQVFTICTKDHSRESCPSLPGLKAVYKEAEEEPESCTYSINAVNCNHDNQVCSQIQLLLFNLHNIMLKNIIQCGKINLPSKIGHNNHFLHHQHGQTKQVNPVVQIFPILHHISKTMYIQHNGPLLLHIVKPRRQNSKDR